MGKSFAHRRRFDVLIDEHRARVTPVDDRCRLESVEVLLVDVDGVVLMDGGLDSLYDEEQEEEKTR
jgi:hypothetical protein